MPRFGDEWLIDRVLFDYVAGGSCACCGASALFLPNGTADLIQAVSDLETDAAQDEMAALATHPWPAELRDQVWADRVRLRQALKKDRGRFTDFWETHQEDFTAWCEGTETVISMRRWLQLPRDQVMEIVRQKYNIHSALGVVLSAVVEQVAGFVHTAYPPDGRGTVELDFEALLLYDRRGGFTLPLVTEEGVLSEDKVQVWLHRMASLGGPVLLERGPSSTRHHKEEADDDPDGPVLQRSGAKPSFASDRRIIRLIIARFFADVLMEKFLKSKQMEPTADD
jgi:hypothetical protein